MTGEPIDEPDDAAPPAAPESGTGPAAEAGLPSASPLPAASSVPEPTPVPPPSEPPTPSDLPPPSAPPSPAEPPPPVEPPPSAYAPPPPPPPGPPPTWGAPQPPGPGPGGPPLAGGAPGATPPPPPPPGSQPVPAPPPATWTTPPPQPTLPGGLVVTGPVPVADDPTGMSAAVLRLSPASYHSAVPSLTVAASRLDPGERVELVAQGMFNDVPGVVVVTDRRVALVNGRQWQPDIVETIYVTDLVVQGWQDHQTAALAFTWAATRVQIDRIFDVTIAHDVAKRVRERVAAATAGPPA